MVGDAWGWEGKAGTSGTQAKQMKVSAGGTAESGIPGQGAGGDGGQWWRERKLFK